MTEDSVPRNCHMAFVSMSLGIFVLVCSGVIAGTLLSIALNGRLDAEDLEKAFYMYEDIGNIMFALGDELVSSVDLTVSKSVDVGNMVVSQKITNKVLNKVKETLNHRWLRTENYIMDEIEERKVIIREFITWNEQMSAINTYIDLSKWIFQNCLELGHDIGQRSQVVTYILFVKGMSQRLGEMALGIAYVKTDSPLNEMNLVRFRIRSKETMDIAFNFEPQALLKLHELQTQSQNVTLLVVEDVLTSGSLRNNGQFAVTYAEAVKEETAGLFLAKEILNNTLYSVVKDKIDRAQKNLYFNMTIVTVSVAGLILCLIFSLISRASARHQTGTESGSRELIYHHF